jgi:hypothetical protein
MLYRLGDRGRIYSPVSVRPIARARAAPRCARPVGGRPAEDGTTEPLGGGPSRVLLGADSATWTRNLQVRL